MTDNNGQLFRNLPLIGRIFHACLVTILTLSIGLANTIIPVTSTVQSNQGYTSSPIASKQAFINSVSNGKKEALVGLWLPAFIGLTIKDQPTDQPGYVSSDPGVATRFALAEDYGSLGLLAHAQIAGRHFLTLQTGQVLTLIHGDGSEEEFRIEEIKNFQALNPKDPRTDFKSIEPESKPYTQEELFYLIYAHPDRLVLQTCIISDDYNLWGRKFIIASKIPKS